MRFEDELLLEEYRNLHRERWERSRRTWTTISIFIAGSFLLVLEAMKNKEQLGISGFFFLMFTATGLIAMSWFIEYTTIRHNESGLRRIIEIEEMWNFKGPEMRHRREQKYLWFKIRKYAWHFLFLCLIFAYSIAAVLFYP